MNPRVLRPSWAEKHRLRELLKGGGQAGGAPESFTVQCEDGRLSVTVGRQILQVCTLSDPCVDVCEHFYPDQSIYQSAVSHQLPPSEFVCARGCRDPAGPDMPGSVQRESLPVGVPGGFLWDGGGAAGPGRRGAVQKHGEIKYNTE